MTSAGNWGVGSISSGMQETLRTGSSSKSVGGSWKEGLVTVGVSAPSEEMSDGGLEECVGVISGEETTEPVLPAEDDKRVI